MFAKKCTLIGLSLTLILGVVLAAYAAPPSALDNIIAGAKKEGTVTVNLMAQYGVDSMARLEKEPKSLAWKLRARVGDRVKWYKEVDEVG